MDLIRPVCAGLAAWLASWVVVPYAARAFVTLDQLVTPLGRALWVIVPDLILFAVIAVLASVAHRAPYRDGPRRHTIAVLGTVALATVITLVSGLVFDIQAWANLTRLATDLAGGVAGWRLMAAIRTLRHRSATRGTYF